MNIIFDRDNPFEGATLRFSIIRIGNFWIEGHSQNVSIRLKPSESFWELFNFLRQRAIEKHRGPITIELNGKDITLESALWQSMVDRLFDWNEYLSAETAEALELLEW